MVLASLGFWDLFWTMLWFFFLVIWIMILFQVIVDLFRNHTTSGVVKALWVIALILFTPITVLIYLIVNARGMSERSLAEQQKAQQQFDSYVRQAAGGGDSPTEQIARAKELLDSGAIDQGEFDKLKAKALG